jgi:PAS domain S-box-containing protein
LDNPSDRSTGASAVALLALVREIVAEAAAQADPDSSLRQLRRGLLRLGFRRAGIWVTDPTDSGVLRGTWGTDWDGSERDEHHLTYPLSAFIGLEPVLAGRRYQLSRLVPGMGQGDPVAMPPVAPDGPPNHACVGLRADGEFLGIISVDLLPVADPIGPEQLAAVDLLADLGAVVVARGRAAVTLRRQLADLERTTEALRQRDEQLRGLFEGVPIGLYRTTPSGELLDGNPAFLDKLGFASLAEIRAMRAAEGYVDPDDRERFQEQLDREGVIRRFESLIRRKNGEQIWIEDNARVVRDAAGQVLYYEGSIQDITERKRAEAALRESEQRFRFLVEHTGDALYRFRFDTMRYDYLSPTIERSTGYTAGEIQRTGWDGIILQRVTPQGEPVTTEQLERLRTLDGAAPFDADYLIRTKSGETRWLADHSEPWWDEAGRLIGSVGILNDITTRKQTEAALAEHYRQIDQLKSEFVSLVSHELRTPLTSIKGFADLLLDEPTRLDAEQREFLEIVKSNADRLVTLIGDLLDISRIEAGKVELYRSVVDVHHLLQTVARSFLPQIEAKQQRLTLTVSPDVAPLWADPDRTTQIVTNLLSNAHKYTPTGGSLRIAARNDAGFVRMDVSDTGIGLTPEEQAQLFSKFFRARNRVTREVGGTGLGLAITRSLVELQDGDITFASAPGAGSTFSVRLPASDRAALFGDGQPVDGEARGERILVVDDEPDVANLLRLYLERGGYQVLVAHSAAEALALARSEPLDLITLDLALRDADGFTLLEWLKSDVLTRDIPVLMISIFDDVGRGKQLGAVDYLHKPVGEATLLARVGRILGEERARLVLVADDEADTRQLIAEYLRRAGCQVIEAADGAEAIQLTKERQPTLALVDVNMPNVDGITVLRTLRSDPSTTDLPILMITASPGVAETSRPDVESLASSLVIKPLASDAWLDLIRQRLPRK